ncbi:MAG: hypothetical protein E5W72_02545 [Mesorhizobium sp.]|nr:MAG: hypothetical protein E5W72_02545 [Mesorhizobium sp.]
MFADPIRASSFKRLHEQAGQKTAPDQCARTTNYLVQYGSHPQKTSQLTTMKVALAHKTGHSLLKVDIVKLSRGEVSR